MDVVLNLPKPGEPSYEASSTEVQATMAYYADRVKLVVDKINSIQV